MKNPLLILDPSQRPQDDRKINVILSEAKNPVRKLWILQSLWLLQNDKINYMNDYYVYILASRRNGTLYTGVTNDLKRRIFEHKNNMAESFTNKYNVHNLVYYEHTPCVESAIEREKQIKGLMRKKKLNLIETKNPEWKDLSEGWY